MLKKVGIAVAVVLVLLLVIIATRPSTYQVVRKTTVAAPGEVAYGFVADFHRWSEWSPWDKLDPNQKRTFEGPAAGEGAIYHWAGNDQVGEGRMTIVGAKSNSQLDIKLEFIKPFASTNQTLFDFIGQGTTGSEIVWTMNGHNDFMGKAMSLFMDMDKMIGPDFEKGLAQLKTVVEAEAKKRAEAAAKAAEEAAKVAAAAAANPVQAPAASAGIAPPPVHVEPPPPPMGGSTITAPPAAK